jgi:hypothetical protein
MTIAADPSDFGRLATSPTDVSVEQTTRRLPGLAVAAAASIGAGAIHAAAAGIHAENVGLTRIFIVGAIAQMGAGLLGLLRPNRVWAFAVAAVNAVAVGGWLATRITGISWIDGLQTAEAPQFADTACALLGAVAAGAAIASLLAGWQTGKPVRLLAPGLAVALLTVPAMVGATSHVHDHGSGATATAADGHSDHAHDDGTTAAAGVAAGDGSAVLAADGHDHSAGADGSGAAAATADDGHAHDHASAAVTDSNGTVVWPRPWDPAQPIDLAGVPGVTPEQEARALALVQASLKELPRYADTADAIADGYRSIGDAGTGSEHFIRYDYIGDDKFLDATAPESLVYTVDGDKRILAGAMYIASARPTDDPTLTDFAGPLMQWHNHGDLCWDRVNGVASVVGVVDDVTGTCARGVNTGGENPMVHVWVTPHPCGVFAALDGVGAGQAAVPDAERVDMCNEAHGDHGGHGSAAAAPTPKPYDPTQPIDLSGTPGVTPQQQAAAENLIAVTLVRLPQWSDYRVAEAAGFRSIGDALTGHEHFINWDWINDDTVLDPDYPESLVYEPLPDGSKKLVSAMYMLPDTVKLTEVPDIGGALMQWHIHDDLCFTNDPDAPRVAGITAVGGACPNGLTKFRPAPMIHVWITPHKCGPFAALEGVGAGQVVPGEEHLCDHAHGTGGF